MLNAIINRKVDRAYFRGNEDSLTSFIFERIYYLPHEIQKRLLYNSVTGNLPEINFETLIELNYWPHWNSENTGNINYIEPDIFIRFKDYDLIIEAKRNDRDQQNGLQWKNQIIAYQNEFELEEKKLVYIALGGIRSNNMEKVEINDKEYGIHKIKWSAILREALKVKKQIEASSGLLIYNRLIERILDDIIEAFKLFGYSASDWFEKFNYEVGITEEAIIKLGKTNFHG